MCSDKNRVFELCKGILLTNWKLRVCRIIFPHYLFWCKGSFSWKFPYYYTSYIMNLQILGHSSSFFFFFIVWYQQIQPSPQKTPLKWFSFVSIHNKEWLPHIHNYVKYFRKLMFLKRWFLFHVTKVTKFNISVLLYNLQGSSNLHC